MAILVTGAAGFIGYHVADRLLARGETVFGIDNLNDYYSVALKRDRITDIATRRGDSFRFLPLDFSDHEALDRGLDGHGIDRIVHLGAQAGVRYSIENPRAYVQANVVGHLNILEFARHRGVAHLAYASSSSVYGGNTSLPFRVEDRVDHPVSLYAATKKADELMSETYAHLYRLPQTGPALLHRLRAVGTARHGLVAVRQSHLRGRADPCVQRRCDAAGFHLYR